MKREERKKRGTSLIETLIASSIGLLLLGLLSSALVFANRYYVRLMSANEIEKQCIAVLELLVNDLSESSLSTVLCEQDTVVFNSPRDLNGSLSSDPVSGGLKWPTLVCYHRNATDQVLTRYLEAKPNDIAPIDPLDLKPDRDGAYFQTNGILSRVVSRDVILFEPNYCDEDGSDPDEEPDIVDRDDATFLKIDLTLEQKEKRTTTIGMATYVEPKNTI